MDEFFHILRAVEGLHKRFDKLEAHINRRLDKMDGDLQAIIDAAKRAEGLEASTLTLISGLVIKVNGTADATLDPATKAQLKALAADLDAEGDKVVEALRANPLPTEIPALPKPVEPAPDPANQADANTSTNQAGGDAAGAGQDAGQGGTQA